MAIFDFDNAKFDLKSISMYLEQKGVNLSQDDKQKLNTIFQDSDVYNDEEKEAGKDGVLNDQEWNNFIKNIEKEIPTVLGQITFFKILLVNNTIKNIAVEEETELKNLSTYVAPIVSSIINIGDKFKQTGDRLIEALQIEAQKKTVKSLINTEIEKRKTSSVNVDIDYWADKIAETSQKYDIPSEIIVSIISRETNGKFNKNINCGNGAGPMQLTEIAVRSFFPGASGNWNDRYQSLDLELLNDILYQKDKDGNFKTDKNGNKILAYSSAKELRNACGKDDELGVKVGTLVFEMKYIESVAIELHGKYTYANVKKVIDGLKDGTIKLTEAQKEKCLQRAFVNYNGADGIKEKYGEDVIDSLRIHNFDFKKFEIFKG